MKSLLNKNNSHTIPFGIIIVLLTIYICPNISFASIGENSLFPAFIFLLSYSFFNKSDLLGCYLLAILCIIFPFINSFDASHHYANLSIISSLMSLYLITIPILSSITLGKIIGTRYALSSKRKTRRELIYCLILLLIFFILTALVGAISPDTIYIFLNGIRTSHNRLVYFFTEPSQSSSVFIGLFLFAFYLYTNSNFDNIIGKGRRIISCLLFIATCILSYLSLPLTLFAQIAISVIIYYTILLYHFLFKLCFSFKINLSILGIKKSLNTLVFFLFNLIFVVPLVYFLLFNVAERVLGLLSALEKYGFGLGLALAAGNRFYYAFTSLYVGLTKPFSLPGDWVGQFPSDLLEVLGRFSLLPGNYIGLFQLYKTNMLVLKPVGWFYFAIYDLGIGIFLIFCYLTFRPYFKLIYQGFRKADYIVISLISIQLALLFMPLLPSTPSVFFPIMMAASIQSYQSFKFENE